MSQNLQLLFTILFLPVCSLAQDLVVANTGQNILYIGFDNDIQFAIKSKQSKDVLLTVSRGDSVTTNGKLAYRNCDSQQGIIKFYAQDKKSKKVMDSTIFRLKLLPNPEIKLVANNMSGGVYLGKNILLDLVGVISFLPDLDLTIKVIEFTMTINKASGQAKNISNKGNKISQDVRDELSKLQDGDLISLNDAKVIVGCETSPRVIKQDLVFKISKNEAIKLTKNYR